MADYAGIGIAFCGIVQAFFLCMLLRTEGLRALKANRWMMVFVIAVAINMSEDVIETIGSPQMEYYGALFFMPVNFAIAPAIYLYFREISGTPPRHQWLHFLPMAIVFNLVAWIFVYNGSTVPENGVLMLWGGADEHKLLALFPHGQGYLQGSIYLALIWKAAFHYFRQTQKQLGANREDMRTWVTAILGAVTFIFAALVISKTVMAFYPNEIASLGVDGSFVIVFLMLSYILATRPVLFVMPDWPDGADDDFDDSPETAPPVLLAPAPKPVSLPRSDAVPVIGGDDRNPPRPLLDDAGIAMARRRLDDIRKHGDLLFDPLISLPKLARAVGVSSNQLSYVLNHHVGQNFFDYVNGARIEEARAVLLAEPDRTILDVALSVGFNSKSTFNLAFKKITGETPSAVRSGVGGLIASGAEDDRK